MFWSGYTARHRSLLRAVGAGRAQLTGGRHPDLCVDGRWCDRMAAAELVRDGLVRHHRPAPLGAIGALVPAVLTEAGAAVLAAFGVTVKAA